LAIGTISFEYENDRGEPLRTARTGHGIQKVSQPWQLPVQAEHRAEKVRIVYGWVHQSATGRELSRASVDLSGSS